MSDADDASEKEHEPSQKRLDDARAKGDLARSADLNTAATYAGLLITAVMIGPHNLGQFGDILKSLLDQADRFGPLIVAPDSAMSGQLMWQIALVSAPWFLLPAGAALVSILVQRSLVFAPDKLEMKLSRINPLANAKQKFGREGLFEFGKSLVKLLVVSGILGAFLVWRLPDIAGSASQTPALATRSMLHLVTQFLFVIAILTGSIGALDFLWQRAQLLRRNRMSRQDMIDEARQSDGDPFMKQKRRQRGQEIAMNRMMLDVPRADVIIVNPTHYAVALQWQKDQKGAPVCVAKGTDEVAARIRSAAAAHGVPLYRDAATARALFATVEIQQEISPDHYRAVAAAIRFAERMRKQGRRRSTV